MRELDGNQETMELSTVTQTTTDADKLEPIAGQAGPFSADMPIPAAPTASTELAFNEQTNYVTRRKIITIFLACSTVDFVALMDQTTLAASLLTISAALGAGSESAWISAAYFLTSTSFQLLYGRLSDIWSRRSVLMCGLVIFFLGSLAASLAQSAVQLVIFRAFTGIGGGGLMTMAQAVVSDVVPLRERGKYQGILGAVVALAHGIGPVVGAVLASQSTNSWRWIFRLNLPLSVFTGICVVCFMPLRKVRGNWKEKLKAIDFLGLILALGGSSLTILGLTWAGGQHAWDSSRVIASLVLGLALSIMFVLWQWRGTRVPLIYMHMFKATVVQGACLTMFVNGWNFLVQIHYIPLFYQLVYGYSVTRSSLLLIPITLVQTVSSTFSGLVVHWIGRYRESILLGWAAWAVGLGLFSTLDERDGLGKQIGYALLAGFGVGQTLQPSLIAVQAGVSRKDMAVMTSTRNFVRNLGGTLGIAVAGTIINVFTRNALLPFDLDAENVRSILNNPKLILHQDSGHDRAESIRAALVPAYKSGFRIVFVIGASLAASAFILTWFLLPQVELKRPDDERLKEQARREEPDV